jgi:glutaredoxin
MAEGFKRIVRGVGVVLVALLVTAGRPAEAAAEIYKWVDAQGQVHFQDRPPGKDATSATVEVTPSTQIRPQGIPAMPSRTAESPAAGTVGGTPEQEPAAAPGIKQVELYTTSWCPWCKKARDYFNERGIAFTDYDVEKDSAAAARRKQLDSTPGVPYAVIDGVGIRGYDTAGYARALQAAP